MVSKHFDDAWYYLRRAGEHTKAGLREEFSGAERRLRKATGREEESASRMETMRSELKRAESRAGGEAKRAVGGARSKLHEYRERRTTSAER